VVLWVIGVFVRVVGVLWGLGVLVGFPLIFGVYFVFLGFVGFRGFRVFVGFCGFRGFLGGDRATIYHH
jgi:hypothetical protein